MNDIEVKVQLSVLKLFDARWLMDNFNFMTSQAGSEVISNRWKAADITEALSKGLNCLESLDPFESTNVLVELNLVTF